jgi:DnaJ-class molecular chaperone
MAQICKTCKSTEVARCRWVNVNDPDVVYDMESGTTLEWCLDCKSETAIVDEDDNDDELICPLCSGEGILDEVLDIKCNICKGKGTINSKLPTHAKRWDGL